MLHLSQPGNAPSQLIIANQINTPLEECRCALPDRCSGFKVHHTPPGNAPSSSIYKKTCYTSCFQIFLSGVVPPCTATFHMELSQPSDPSHYRGSLGTSRPHFRSIPPPCSGALTPQQRRRGRPRPALRTHQFRVRLVDFASCAAFIYCLLLQDALACGRLHS